MLCFQTLILISQGSVATPLRCGGICNDLFIVNFLMSVTVKEFFLNDHTLLKYQPEYIAYFFEPCTLYFETVRNGCPRSSKIVVRYQSKARMNVLLVINSNFGPILPRFKDIAGFFAENSDPTHIPSEF